LTGISDSLVSKPFSCLPPSPRSPQAEATALRGEAEAYAIEVKAKAEAEQMAKKADAWNEYKEAALVDMMLMVGRRCQLDPVCIWYTTLHSEYQIQVGTP
jgi:hypothetical protein